MTNPRVIATLVFLASAVCLALPSSNQPRPREEAHNSSRSEDNANTTSAERAKRTQTLKDNKVFKRSYYPSSYTNSIQPAPFQSISVWKPPVYQLSRPYYVPVFGASGRINVFYPPQPLYLNPGTPQVNPSPPFMGPAYLPPVTQQPPEDTTMKFDDRFNNDNDDKPIWDVVNPGDSSASTVPTRPPKKAGSQSTSPPLIHNPGGGSGSSAVAPPPAGRPGASRQPETTTAVPGGPSQCVWAIISCCSATSEIRYNCFEQLGCTGAFWDRSPCEGEFAEAAIQQALNYYNP